MLAVSALKKSKHDGYMTTHPELGLQPNLFPDYTNRLAINQVMIY